MPKQQIEIDIPDGYEFVRFGPVESGEWYIDDEWDVVFWNIEHHSAGKYIVIRPIERWRVPTKMDLLNRDSIPCRYRAGDDCDWREGNLIAVSNKLGFLVRVSSVCFLWYKQCEIRDTEPRPLEIWGRKLDDHMLAHTYKRKEEAMAECRNSDTKVVRFVEVPE